MRLIARATAPVKVILSGEHGVVHGTPAITLTIEPLNAVELYEAEGKPELVVESSFGTFTLNSKGEIASGTKDHYSNSLSAMVRHLIKEHRFSPKKKLVAKTTLAGAPKGMGSSSSIAAALASCLFSAMGKKPKRGKRPDEDELWLAVQACDEVAHGGRPSGIDAYSVCYGPTRLTKLAKNGKVEWEFSEQNVSTPKDTKLIVVDTFKGERAETGKMIEEFAKANLLLNKEGKVKAFLELDETDSKKLEPFRKAFEEIVKHLNEKGDALKLGRAMHENHLLLSKSGVSTKEIEHVVKIALENGAYGAKLTGAGGKGGAVIILAPKDDSALQQALLNNGYKVFAGKPVMRGTLLEVNEKPSEKHSE